MSTEALTPEVIDAYKELLLHPKENGLDFDSITDCFEKSGIVTAKHILSESYIKYIGRPIHKLVMYIIMDQVFGNCDGKDEKGDLGYHLKFTK